ncbi:MAG: exo-alpha-sialidase [Defluviitaleaceae bacterium]|nr:exo-alpha-sialidase [Defluviitaleaceae bacterium]
MNCKIIRREHIFKTETFFPQCHASTVEMMPCGGVAAAWFAGSHEKAADVAIWFSVLADIKNGRWSVPRKIAEHPGVPCWNPVLFVNAEELIIYYKVGHEITEWCTYTTTSSDGGATWTAASELVPGDASGGRGPVKNKNLRLKNGIILAPTSVEKPLWECFVDISRDDGKTWVKSATVPRKHNEFTGTGIIQPTLWEGKGGLTHMLMRSSEGCIYQSYSADFGGTWSVAERTELPNNNCGIDAIKLADGRVVLAYNAVAGNWAARSPIALIISEDDGRTWGEPIVLEHTPCDPKINIEDTEFSYPAIVARDNEVFITYTWKRRTIAFWCIEIC